MRDFGIRMEGCEDAIEAIVKEACERFRHDVFFRYLEIGVGGGGTFAAITSIIKENHGEWLTVGVDLPNGWSLDKEQIPMRVGSLFFPAPHALEPWAANIVLMPSAEFLKIRRENVPNGNFHVVLIDGCHGKACVMADFLGVEPLVEKGGFVIFHDAGIDEQGVDMQPHCGEPINVRNAIAELGLLWQPDGIGYRDGWEWHTEIPGDKSRGGHSCVVVQKV